MKIGFISDTHHNLNSIDRILDNYHDVDLWLHAGDNIDDAEYLAQVSERPVKAVCGNTDWPTSEASELIIDLPGHKIFLTHGDRYGVNQGLDIITARAKELGCNTIVFGHTHHGLLTEKDNILIINPGSTAKPRDGLAPSFMVGTINKDNKLDIDRIFLD